MSTVGATASVPLAPPVTARAVARSVAIDPEALVRLAAFAGLSALAAWSYAGIETRPPGSRVAAITAASIAAGAALTLIRAPHEASRPARAWAAASRVIVLAALLAVALLAAGVPAQLLRPGGWGTLADRARDGLDPLSFALWPYAGNSSWARVDILLALATMPIAAAALAFWPVRRGAVGALVHCVRQLGALALLLTLYVIGVLEGRRGSTSAEGLMVLALLAAWLWLPGLRVRRLATALAWLASMAALAVVLAGQIAGGQAWLGYRAWDLFGTAAPRIAFSWDQTYGPITWSRSGRVMFTVSAARPQLWKTATLDRFDGLRFVRSGTDAASYVDLPLPVNDRWYTFATFSIQGLSSDLLPTEQGTTMGVNFGHGTRHDRDGTTQTLGPALRGGDSYTVLSYVPNPTPTELRAALRAFPAAYLRYTDFDLPSPSQSALHLAATDPRTAGKFFTHRTVGAPAPGVPPAAAPGVQRRILASPYGPMYRLARRLASGSRSTYGVALAIESYLKANYTYSEKPPARQYPLESFLFEDRIGYCQQFSGAMALMLRMDGIPARVAAGFLPGTYDGQTRELEVRALDAHSWVEVYFSGIGWVPFNPTPARSLPRPNGPVFASERSVSVADAIAATVGAPPRRSATREAAAGGGGATAPAGAPVAVIAAAVASALALLALAARWLGGRVRLRRSLDGDGELATQELVRALRTLGYAIPPTVTLAQVERVVSLHGGPDAARYVRLLRDQRYAAGSVTAATLRDRRRLRRGLTAHLGFDARLRGLWALPPATVSRITRAQTWLDAERAAGSRRLTRARSSRVTRGVGPSASAGGNHAGGP
jgi:transglutaminase-like putative cysteine protease